MVLGGAITKYAVLALGAILLIFFLLRSREVGIGPAASEIGQSLGSIGGGIGQLGSGIGTGLSGLFNPAYTVIDLAQRGRNLIFGGNAQTAAPANTKVLGQQPAQPSGGGTVMVQDNNKGGASAVPKPTQADINAAILKAHPRGSFNRPAGTYFSAVNTLTPLGTEVRATVSRLLGSNYFRNAESSQQATSLANYYLTSFPTGLLTEAQRRSIQSQLAGRGRR